MSRDEDDELEIISPGQLPMRRDNPTAHVAKDWEAVLVDARLDMTVETPEKNQQAPVMEALGEASRLFPKDAVTEYVSASAFLSFEDWRELYLGLFSNSLDEDKRKVLLSVTVKPGVTITPQDGETPTAPPRRRAAGLARQPSPGRLEPCALVSGGRRH